MLKANQRRRGTALDSVDVLSNLGAVYESQADWEEALRYYHMARTIEEQENRLSGLAWTYHHLGMSFMGLKQLDSAKYYLDRAHQLAVNSQHLVTEVEVLESLTYWFSKSGIADSTEWYLARHNERKDELYANQMAENLQTSLEKYDLERLKSAVVLEKERVGRARAESENRRFLIIILIGALLAVCTMLVLGFRFHQQKRYINQMELNVKEQQLVEMEAKADLESLKAMLQGQEKERNRIARDLHDRVGNLLATLKLSLTKNKEEENTPHVDLVNQTVKEVHNIAQDLSGDLIENYGLILALKELKQKVERSTGLEMHLYLDERTDDCNKASSLEIYRILQELTANTLKHAEATQISLQTLRIENSLNLIYEDNGKGFDPGQIKEGMGSRNIRSRIDLLKCTYQVDSQPGRGTIVILDVHV
ncbi:tetratricopeptide repeat protein [bacterium SCSIO 12741]|nr:tetratricopeptide repeat protein [bacterium SCSIO 12741]